MIAFGLGTLPVMLGLSYASGRFTPPGATLARLLGSVIVACGLRTASVTKSECYVPRTTPTKARKSFRDDLDRAGWQRRGRLRRPLLLL
jgi:hypothetical protein